MNKEIITLINKNTQEIVDFVKAIDTDKVQASPPSGKWSIIQICDHLVSVDFGVYSMMTSEGKTADADRKSLLPTLEAIVIDRTKKAVAPPQLAPKGKTDTVEKFATKYPNVRGKMINSIESKDLSKVCDVFPHFVFGHMTYEEWLRFTMLHADRHVLQMKEVLTELQVS